MRNVGGAIQLFDYAQACGYDANACSAGRWTCYMLLGEFGKAWKESDAIAGRGKPDPHAFWNGSPLSGRRVLIRCLHGLGDTIQFLRYAPLIRSEASSVVIESQPRLKALIECSGLADHVITWGDREPEWDQQIEVMELPRIFRTALDAIPVPIPYLRIPDSCRLSLPAGRLRVALVWESGAFNASRSIPLSILSRVCRERDFEFFSFQAGPEREELARCTELIKDWDERTNTLLGAAASLEQMDLLITVDTMMAHLAGALGKPVWTLLPYEADWRWMLNRNDSPWYPSMRLFRQIEPGDWDSVVEEVRRALQDLKRAVRLSPVPDLEA